MNEKDQNIFGASYADGGEVALDQTASSLLDKWREVIASRLKDVSKAPVEDVPDIIGADVLTKAGYLDSFPQQVIKIDDEHYRSPAACFHVYSGASAENTSEFMVYGKCARHEGGNWEFPFKLSKFHMLELVSFGTEENLNHLKDRLTEILTKMFEGYNLDGSWNAATDAFFLGESSGAKIMQQLKGLKQEYQVEYQKNKISLASINMHEDYFTSLFKIHQGKHSLCCAFGLERITFYSLSVWGQDKENWPSEFKI